MLKRKGRRYFFPVKRFVDMSEQNDIYVQELFTKKKINKNKRKQFYSKRYNFLMAFNEI